MENQWRVLDPRKVDWKDDISLDSLIERKNYDFVDPRFMRCRLQERIFDIESFFLLQNKKPVNTSTISKEVVKHEYVPGLAGHMIFLADKFQVMIRRKSFVVIALGSKTPVGILDCSPGLVFHDGQKRLQLFPRKYKYAPNAYFLAVFPSSS